ncbi:hypothetical protein KC726_03015 [Candidatus Woesebacteria bacterium]|nr:hypothetical protein [Candidatus Woesebacteria bacterium]
MNTNRTISLILGFVIIILVFVWVNNQLRSKPSIQGESTAQTTPTPTQTKSKNPFSGLFGGLINSPTPTQTPTPTTNKQANQENGVLSEVHSIPKTGTPTIIVPLLFSSLGIGTYLRRKTS